MPTFLKLFQTMEEQAVPTSFYKASITLIPKSGKDTIRNENYRSMSLININLKKKVLIKY